MELNKYIDHTLLKADASTAEVLTLLEEAKEYDFMSVCINPDFVQLAARELQGTEVKVCTVIGFPLGANVSATKAFETQKAIEAGADEVDMVINLSAAKDGRWEAVQEDIEAVVQAAKGKALVKVIIETCLLTDEEKVKACMAAKNAGADFVKTSTGFSTGGAKVEDIRLMRKTVGPQMGVKASGGVGDRQAALEMIEAGATRIGASKGIQIVSQD